MNHPTNNPVNVKGSSQSVTRTLEQILNYLSDAGIVSLSVVVVLTIVFLSKAFIQDFSALSIIPAVSIVAGIIPAIGMISESNSHSSSKKMYPITLNSSHR